MAKRKSGILHHNHPMIHARQLVAQREKAMVAIENGAAFGDKADMAIS